MSPYAKHDARILKALEGGWYEREIEPRLRRNEQGCLIWTASLNGGGYGQVSVPGKGQGRARGRAHRVVWLHLRGEIPLNHVLDHHGPNGCGNKACCEPDHLQVVTIRDNIVATGNGMAARSHRGEFGCTHPRTPGARCAECQGARDALRSQAARALGMRLRDYFALYGQSVRVARQVIADSAMGRAA